MVGYILNETNINLIIFFSIFQFQVFLLLFDEVKILISSCCLFRQLSSSAKGISEFHVNRESNAAKETLVELYIPFLKDKYMKYLKIKEDVHNVLYTLEMLVILKLKILKPRPIPT